MSYWVRLNDPVDGRSIELDSPHQMRGGVYEIGGTIYAELNVTYNYSKHFAKVIDGGLRGLGGMSAVDSIPILKAGIEALGYDSSEYYWDSTEGNAKKVLHQLLALAKMRPDGVWEVTA